MSVAERLHGALLGQLCGDSLGALVEGKTPSQIAEAFPDGVKHMANGGTWMLLPGQCTDDSEMAIAAAQSVLHNGGVYNVDAARALYQRWLKSHPFDVGLTVKAALSGSTQKDSLGNGALMRASVFGCLFFDSGIDNLRKVASVDCAITHPHPVCIDANVLYVALLAHAIKYPCSPLVIMDKAKSWVCEWGLHDNLRHAVHRAEHEPVSDFITHSGHVLIALQNALFQLTHADCAAQAITDTIRCGGDTDTNAAIAGALFGAMSGEEAFPLPWVRAVMECRPSNSNPDAWRPRPEWLWPRNLIAIVESVRSDADPATISTLLHSG